MNVTISFNCLDLYVDELVPCLKNNETGALVETVVFRIETRSFLRKYNTYTGWHIDWFNFGKDTEVYALATKSDMGIQGLIALKPSSDAKAVFMIYACTAPHNNKKIMKREDRQQKYAGVGGHLFAIAIDKSICYGFGGCVFGYAANEKILKHYINQLSAEYIGVLHQYHFIIQENAASKILEVYDYEWNNSNS